MAGWIVKEANKEIKEFFDGCVKDKDRFKKISETKHKELHDRVMELREILNNPKDMMGHQLTCYKYIRESKRLIILVSFDMLKKEAPSDELGT